MNAVISNMRLTKAMLMDESAKTGLDADIPNEYILMDSVINQMLITVSP